MCAELTRRELGEVLGCVNVIAFPVTARLVNRSAFSDGRENDFPGGAA